MQIRIWSSACTLSQALQFTSVYLPSPQVKHVASKHGGEKRVLFYYRADVRHESTDGASKWAALPVQDWTQ